MSEVFERNLFFLTYLKWHYGRGIRELFKVCGNFLWFVSNFFSFKLLFKTLFAPWKRLGEHYGSIFNFEEFASVFIVNSLMRLVGFCTKIVVIVFGFGVYILVLILSFLAFIFWLLAPILLIICAVLAFLFFYDLIL